MLSRLLVPVFLAISACSPTLSSYDSPTRAFTADIDLPEMRVFSTPRAQPPARSNAEIARDFLDLTMRMESGRYLPYFTRFEGPITVAVRGTPSPTLTTDLGRLIYRLRTEAGLNITQTSNPDASIVVNATTRKAIQKVLPQAACFVAPNVSTLAEYRLARRTKLTSWSAMRERKKITIFVPTDVSPQETRDCLHEELSQALGPLNDLYRLADSIYNDDNLHTVLTGFDMLILKTIYAPELHSGMNRRQVANRLPEILARLNPAGQRPPGKLQPYTPKEWRENMITALAPGANMGQRLRAAEAALQIAKARNLTDVRMGYNWYAIGLLTERSDPERSFVAFQNAYQYYQANSGTDIHKAQVASRIGSYALRNGNPSMALKYIEPSISAAIKGENAALLSALMLLRSEALMRNGMATDARAARVDSLGWARYGFGSERELKQRLRVLTGFSPL
ncbi:DUF2927 domain-containing protein [Donghicola sp.]|jgi:hypothetical protein|uniref:DUF2927 domain-containing protein n=1 Tax=Donghicola sp. TaxID=1929294 RepID=UPI0025FD03CF|nr:DUF2927 domain-containing protein [Donghicola sp.]MCT4577325.1 DUF2927 domain-containing protein [Donghicola sp.]